jgi:hypothetical protein
MNSITVTELVEIVRSDKAHETRVESLATKDIKRLITDAVRLIRIPDETQEASSVAPHGFDEQWETMNSALHWIAKILESNPNSSFPSIFLAKIEQENDTETAREILVLFLSVALVRLAKEAEAFDRGMEQLLGSNH